VRLATVAEAKNNLTKYLGEAHRRREPILVTKHGKPYALIRAIEASDIETLDWGRLSQDSLRRAWEGDDDRYYAYL